MENGNSTSEPKPPKLLDRVRSWIRRFVIFHHKQHPAEMGDPEVRQFLTDLAEKQSVSASTQNQAAKRFGVPLSGSTPIAASKAEVQSVLKRMQGVARLVAVLLYGSGLDCWSV